MSTTALEKRADKFVQGLSLQQLREYAFNHILVEYMWMKNTAISLDKYYGISDDKLLNDFIKEK
jgi:hypothetical protein